MWYNRDLLRVDDVVHRDLSRFSYLLFPRRMILYFIVQGESALQGNQRYKERGRKRECSWLRRSELPAL
jgi:hypothetical protein